MRTLICIAFAIQFLSAGRISAQDYFQQDVRYKIDVTLNDNTHQLSAYEEIVYRNNSPQTLHTLYFHLWPNAYANENTFLAREFYKNGNATYRAMQAKSCGFIDSLDFRVDNETVTWSLLPDTIDICCIKLNRPLEPGDSVIISTPFRVQVPDASISRLGHNGQAYYITQWYPKPAVFDRNGWNYFPYLDKGEYYSEFGSFDVRITLPQNYVVGSTGILVNNPSEEEWMNSKAKETSGMDEFPTDMSFPPSSSETKTLHYFQDRVHDFAWFADKRWHVLKGNAELPGSANYVTTWALFTNKEPQLWKKVPEYLKNSIVYGSRWIGDYPFSQVTAVDVEHASGSGMEYPMITAIGTEGYPMRLEVVIVHEVMHNWFYGILGSNERRHPWMDEGLTKFIESRYFYTHYAGSPESQEVKFYRFGKKAKYVGLSSLNIRQSNYLAYITGARKNSDQSPDLSAEQYSGAAYREDVYRKTSCAFEHLLAYLGDSLFDKAMRNYYSRWSFKHPQPEDIRKVFEETSRKDLGWIFNDFLLNTKKSDYAITGLKKTAPGVYQLKIKNKGSIAAPVSVSGIREEKALPPLWTEGFTGTKTITMRCDSCEAFRIDAQERELELFRKNNSIRTAGVLRRVERLKIQFPAAVEHPERTQLFVSPIAGWNAYNQVMAGAAFYNIFSPEKKLEYVFAPMYSFRLKEAAGGGQLRYHLYPGKTAIQKITLQTGLSRYAYADDNYSNEYYQINHSSSLHFTKLDSRIQLLFRNKDRKEKLTQTITFRHVYLLRKMPFGIVYPFASVNERDFISKLEKLNYFQAEGESVNRNEFYANAQKITFSISKEFHKVVFETKNFLSYGKEGKGMDIRFFAGAMHISKNNKSGIDYNMRLSGVDGSHDFFFDEIFPGRNETQGIWSQQFVVADAGFKMPSLFYRKANQWMLGVNLSTTLPGILPFKLFADIGAFNDAQTGYPEARAISWEWGIELPVIKDIFVVYFPITYSDDLKYIVDHQELHYGNLIRFELHLKKLNPLDLFRSIKF
ncbi:MAG TPA: M1 family metallopeptidase [Bacteroidia bacterium]|nr:M1 family metallopeptidase [Bacteroidia bacterium]